MLKIGVLGVGHLGKIHLKCIQQIERYELVGFYDPDMDRSAQIEQEFGVPAFESAELLMAAVELIDIVTPTISHFQLAKQALLAGCHLFIEKPLTHTLDEAAELLTLAQQKERKVQVGHVERFNPAVLALKDVQLKPMFIEAHRLASFNPRGTDVPVVLDLMIHDLDIILSMVKSEVQQVSASGVAVVSQNPDIANARIEFKNGCVANLTASRISMKQMRKLRLFQKDAYISLDFLSKTTQVIRLYDEAPAELKEEGQLMTLETNDGQKHIHMSMQEPPPVNAIQMELDLLAQSIEEDLPIAVSLEEGYQVLELAHKIIDEMELREQKYRNEETV